MSRTIILLAAAIAAAVPVLSIPAAADDTGFAYSHDLRRERGRLCMSDHYHYGNGSGRSLKTARHDAIQSWANFTALEYGSDWARFGRAASKAQKCGKSGSGYDCSVEARPCK